MEQRLRLKSKHQSASSIAEGYTISFLPLLNINSLQLSFDLIISILIWIGILLPVLLAVGGYLAYRYARSNMRSHSAFMTTAIADLSAPEDSATQNESMYFPKICPYCNIRLNLSRIIWVGEKSGKCHNCGVVIHAES